MARGSGNDKQMPYEVAVPQASLRREEREPAGVRKAAQKQKEETRRGHPDVEGIDGDHNEPAHQEVEGDGDDGMGDSAGDLERDPDNREAPDNPEKAPTPRTAQNAESEGGVRTGDQKKNS